MVNYSFADEEALSAITPNYRLTLRNADTGKVAAQLRDLDGNCRKIRIYNAPLVINCENDPQNTKSALKFVPRQKFDRFYRYDHHNGSLARVARRVERDTSL